MQLRPGRPGLRDYIMLGECSRAGGAPGVLGLGAMSSDPKEQEVNTNTEWESHLRHLKHLRHRGKKFCKLIYRNSRDSPSKRSYLFLLLTWQARLPSLLWIHGVCVGWIREDDLTQSYQIFIRFLRSSTGWIPFHWQRNWVDSFSDLELQIGCRLLRRFFSTFLFRLRAVWLTWTEHTLIWIQG